MKADYALALLTAAEIKRLPKVIAQRHVAVCNRGRAVAVLDGALADLADEREPAAVPKRVAIRVERADVVKRFGEEIALLDRQIRGDTPFATAAKTPAADPPADPPAAGGEESALAVDGNGDDN